MSISVIFISKDLQYRLISYTKPTECGCKCDIRYAVERKSGLLDVPYPWNPLTTYSQKKTAVKFFQDILDGLGRDARGGRTS